MGKWDDFWARSPPPGEVYVGGDFNTSRDLEIAMSIFREKRMLVDVLQDQGQNANTFRKGNGGYSRLDSWWVRDPTLAKGLKTPQTKILFPGTPKRTHARVVLTTKVVPDPEAGNWRNFQAIPPAAATRKHPGFYQLQRALRAIPIQFKSTPHAGASESYHVGVVARETQRHPPDQGDRNDP